MAGWAGGQRALAPGAAAATAQAALDLREFLAQHLLLVEAEGRVVGILALPFPNSLPLPI